MRPVIFLTILLSLVFNTPVYSQGTLTGVVRDESGKPLPAASIFLAGTSFGSVADNEGRFSLGGMIPGRYDLVASCIGYKTYTLAIDTRQPLAPLAIVLAAKTEELDNVTIGPGEESTWEKWGAFFLENFIGTMPESKQCTLENSSALRFRFFPKQRLLRATASKPLVIQNKALGYTITYQLEYFQYDFESKIVYYLGYPLFTEMAPANERRKKAWEQNRMEAYYGSQLHFLRSIYRNKALEEGFEMRKMEKRPNTEKERVKKLMYSNVTETGSISISLNGNGAPLIGSGNADSASYYRRVLNQPDMLDLLHAPVLPGDSVAFRVNPYTAGMEFSDYLHITYTREKEHPDYVRAQMRNSQKPGDQVSVIKMNGQQILEIDQQGMVNDPLILLTTGYWGWNDKIGTLLPFNYKLPLKK